MFFIICQIKFLNDLIKIHDNTSETQILFSAAFSA